MATVKEAQARLDALKQESDPMDKRALEAFTKGIESFCKEAAIDLATITAALKDPNVQRMLLGGGVGALGGAGVGAAVGDEENQTRNAILGALAGGGLGTAAGYGYNRLHFHRHSKLLADLARARQQVIELNDRNAMNPELFELLSKRRNSLETAGKAYGLGEPR